MKRLLKALAKTVGRVLAFVSAGFVGYVAIKTADLGTTIMFVGLHGGSDGGSSYRTSTADVG